jgi:hypothetical protein
MPPFPKRLKRTLELNPRVMSTIFSAANIAPPAEEGIKESDRLLRAGDELPLLYGVYTNTPAVPIKKAL